MARRYANQGAAILNGFEQGMRIAGAFRDASDKAGLADAMNAAATEDKAAVTEVNAPDAANYTKDSETGNYAPSLAAVQSGVADSLRPIQEPQFEKKTDRVDKQFASVADRRLAMVQAGIDYLNKKGLPDKALDLQEKFDHQQSRALQLKAATQRQSDDDELRSALAGGGVSVANALSPRNSEMRSSISTGADITGASSVLEHKPAPDGETPAPEAKQAHGLAPEGYDLNAYLKTMAPRAVQTLLKQGKVQEAKQFNDFVESEEGRAYAKQWIDGVRLHAIGDSAGALSKFEKMYNDQLYNDGHTVKLTPLEGGKQYRIDQISADGKVLGSKTADTSSLANTAASALSPMKAVKFHAEQQAQRDKEAALLDRQIQVKTIDAQRDELREDRRDERLATRLAAKPAGGLTLTQQKNNAEIDAAREAVAGMDPAEIRRLTAKATATGRENPDYRPELDRAARLAGRRKVGADDVFDNAQGQQEQPSGGGRSDVAHRFRGDRSMDGHTLGKETPLGVEVLKGGKVIGHYR